MSIWPLQTKARSVSKHQGQNIITLWQRPRKAYTPGTYPPSPCGQRTLTTQKHVQPRKALHTGVQSREARHRLLPKCAGNVLREVRTLALLAELKLPALVTGAAPGPASSPVPWLLLAPLHSPAAKLLPLSWHFFPPPLPWAFTSDGISRNRWRYIGTRHIWFNTSLPCSSAIFAEPKNWAPYDRAIIHFSFFVFLLGKIPQPVLVLACHTICQRILR